MVVNNTITGNSSPSGGGIYCDGVSSPTIANTILAWNSSGFCKESGSGIPILRSNCVYGNATYNYSGVVDPTGTNGNTSINPGLAQPFYANVHIQPGSPCLDAGDDSVVQAGWTDMDGQPRKQGVHVDIGADESDGTVWPPGSNSIVRVSLQGKRRE